MSVGGCRRGLLCAKVNLQGTCVSSRSGEMTVRERRLLIRSLALLILLPPLVFLQQAHHDPYAGTTLSSRIYGYVTDSNDRPLSDAFVHVATEASQTACSVPNLGSIDNLDTATRGNLSSRQLEAWTTVRTGRDGQFGIPVDPKASSSRLTLIRAPGFAPSLSILHLARRNKVQLSEAKAIVIYLRNEHDQPQPEAEAMLVPLSLCHEVVEAFPDVLIQRSTSDVGGILKFLGVPPGTYALRMTSRGSVVETIMPFVV